MKIQPTLFKKVGAKADVIYTPTYISKHIIKWLNPTGKILDPCKGEGAFYNYLPADKYYCELTENKDFFYFNDKVDWIIGNPPYSIFEEFLKHAFEIADNVSYLVPTNKIFQRQLIMGMITKYGGIKSIIIYGSGQLIGFPFGFSVGNFHFKKGYKGETKILMGVSNIFPNGIYKI